MESKAIIGISKKEELASNQLIEFMKIMSEPNRFNIILLLYKNHELSVSEISGYLKISQPAVSQHLKILKLSNIIKLRKIGRNVFYSLDIIGLKNTYKAGIGFLRAYFMSEKI